MTRQQIISALIDDDIQNVLTGECNSWLESILNSGFVGYSKQTLKELKQEYKERELENKLSQ